MIFGGDLLDLFEQLEQVQCKLFAAFRTHLHWKLVEAISTCQAFPRFHHSLNPVEPKRFIIVWESWVNGWRF
jgi:hypothetical protein